jgi:hypothetical protein
MSNHTNINVLGTRITAAFTGRRADMTPTMPA